MSEPNRTNNATRLPEVFRTRKACCPVCGWSWQTAHLTTTAGVVIDWQCGCGRIINGSY